MKSIFTRAAIVSCALMVSSNAFASDYTQTNRYTKIENVVSHAQANPLKVVVNTDLPQSVVSVRDAMEFLLMRSGYVLASDDVLSEEAISMLRLQLPAIQRRIEHVTLDLSLSMLAGNAFDLVVDPIHRKVAFTVKPEFQALYGYVENDHE